MEGPSIGTGEPVVESSMDWRSELQPDYRPRIVEEIMEKLKRHISVSGDEGLRKLKNVAERFEEKIYSTATSQSDYLNKISLKMLTFKTKSKDSPMGDSLLSNSMEPSNKPLDSTSQSMQSQAFNQRLSMLSMAMPSYQPQHSSSLPSEVSPFDGLASASMPNIVSTVRNVPGVPPSSVGSSMDQGSPSNVFSHIPQQQQNLMPLNQLQSSQQPALQISSITQPSLSNLQQNQQSPIQLPYQPMLQQPPQPVLRQHQQHPFCHFSIMPQQMNLASQLQQQRISQPNSSNMKQNQLTGQKNSVGVMQQQSSLSNMLTPPSQLQHPSMAQLSSLSNLQQQQLGPQSIVSGLQRQQMHGTQLGNSNWQSNQHSTHMLQPNIQQMNLASQLQQQRISQPNSSNMKQNQLTGQKNSVGDMQQQSSLSNMLTPPLQLQHPSMAQLSSLSNLQQQQLGPQSIVSGLQRQQMHGTQLSNSNLQSNQHSTHMLQPNTVQMQQSPSTISDELRQLMSQIPMQSTQVQQQQPRDTMSDDLQQRLQAGDQAPSSLLQTQNVMDQPKLLYSAQSALPETSSTSSDSTAQAGQANGGDWQEEIYQKIKAMKDLYYIELKEMHQKILPKLHQFDSNPQQPKSEHLNKLRAFKGILERLLSFLQVQKSSIDMGFKDKISHYERQIVSFLNSNRPRNLVPTLQPGQLPAAHMQSIQQSQPQMTTLQSVAPVQQTDMQHNSLSTFSGSAPQQLKMVFPMQPSSLQQVVVQQNSVNNSSLPSQNGVNALQQNISSLQSNPNMLQHQHPQQFLQSRQQQPVKLQSLQEFMQSQQEQQQQPVNALQQNISSLQSNPNMLQHQHPQQLLQSRQQQPVKLQSLQEFMQSQQEFMQSQQQSLIQKLPSLQQQLKPQLQKIQSAVRMIHMLIGSASGNGSRAAVLEDLDARTEGWLQARNFDSHYVVSSTGSVDDVFKPLNGTETSDLKSPATSSVKRTSVEAQDWRSLLQPESRQQIIDKIMEILEKHLPHVVGHEGLIELRKMVETFENEIYITAVNQILESLKIED